LNNPIIFLNILVLNSQFLFFYFWPQFKQNIKSLHKSSFKITRAIYKIRAISNEIASSKNIKIKICCCNNMSLIISKLYVIHALHFLFRRSIYAEIYFLNLITLPWMHAKTFYVKIANKQAIQVLLKILCLIFIYYLCYFYLS